MLWLGDDEKEREDDFEPHIRRDALEAWRNLGADTRSRYKRWYNDARSIQSRGKKTEIVKSMIQAYRKSNETGQVPKGETIRRTLNEYFFDWEV